MTMTTFSPWGLEWALANVIKEENSHKEETVKAVNMFKYAHLQLKHIKFYS